jgi:cytochrome b561
MAQSAQFSLLQRILHWLMAAMILAMLFIGIGMVSTLSPRYKILVDIHKPLGVCILILAVLRLWVRWRRGTPPLPTDLPGWQIVAAKASHWLLYALMLALPLIGWAMLSAGGYPVVVWPGINLPAVVHHDDYVYAMLRSAHTNLALLLFATVLIHLAAALFHALVRCDEVFPSMAGFNLRKRKKS